MTPLVQTGRSVRRYLADRLDLLQQTIDHLGTRLREGIASAIGQTVADAAQVAVRSILAGLQPSPTLPTEDRRYGSYATYPPDEPSYYDGWEHPEYDPALDVEEPPTPPLRPSRWKLAITAAVQVLAYCLRQPPGGRTLLTAIGVAAVTGAAALLGGPVGATGAAVLGTALSLVSMTDGTRSWVSRLFHVTTAN